MGHALGYFGRAQPSVVGLLLFAPFLTICFYLLLFFFKFLFNLILYICEIIFFIFYNII